MTAPNNQHSPLSAEFALTKWRQILASVPQVDARANIFEQACDDIGSHVARGVIDKATAADQLRELATAHGLFEAFDEGDIQGCIVDGFRHGEEAERATGTAIDRVDPNRRQVASNVQPVTIHNKRTGQISTIRLNGGSPASPDSADGSRASASLCGRPRPKQNGSMSVPGSESGAARKTNGHARASRRMSNHHRMSAN